MARVITMSEAASIALHGMVLVAKQGSLNVLEIAEKTGTSRHHVAKIMQRLVKQNFLYSHRGPNGGFELRKKPEEINFLDIYEAIEGTIELTECPLEKSICSFDKCIMNNIAHTMTIQFREYLQSQTLDQYVLGT